MSLHEARDHQTERNRTQDSDEENEGPLHDVTCEKNMAPDLSEVRLAIELLCHKKSLLSSKVADISENIVFKA